MPGMNELARFITTTTTGTGISTMEMSIIKRCLPVEEVVGVR
jgi:hypothetical protein